MSEIALRAWTFVSLASFALALAGAVALRGMARPRAETAAALCGSAVQVGLYTLLIAAWRGTRRRVPSRCLTPSHLTTVPSADLPFATPSTRRPGRSRPPAASGDPAGSLAATRG